MKKSTMKDRSIDTPPSRSGGITLRRARSGRLGERVDGLGDQQGRPTGPPLAREDPDPVEDDAADEHEEVEEDDEPQDLEHGIHGTKSDRSGWMTRTRVGSALVEDAAPGHDAGRPRR